MTPKMPKITPAPPAPVDPQEAEGMIKGRRAIPIRGYGSYLQTIRTTPQGVSKKLGGVG